MWQYDLPSMKVNILQMYRCKDILLVLKEVFVSLCVLQKRTGHDSHNERMRRRLAVASSKSGTKSKTPSLEAVRIAVSWDILNQVGMLLWRVFKSAENILCDIFSSKPSQMWKTPAEFLQVCSTDEKPTLIKKKYIHLSSTVSGVS